MKYLTIDQTSRKLGGRSRSSIYRDMKAGILPSPVRIGGRVYFIEEKIDEHFGSQLKEAA
ncbi:MAG: helix-turn-helix domain-containing protein [Pseudomonadota bacterium]